MKRSRTFNRSTSSTNREPKAKKIRVHSQEPLDNQGYPIMVVSNLQVYHPTFEYLNSQMGINRNRIEDKSTTFFTLVKYDPNIHSVRVFQQSNNLIFKRNYIECFSSDTLSDHSCDMDEKERFE